MANETKHPSSGTNEPLSSGSGGFDQQVFDQAQFDEITPSLSPFTNETKH